MNLDAMNRLSPMDKLRSEYASVMASLVRAMKAAQNWHDIVQVAEAMLDVDVCHFRPMLREAEYLASDGAAPTASQMPAPESEAAP